MEVTKFFVQETTAGPTLRRVMSDYMERLLVEAGTPIVTLRPNICGWPRIVLERDVSP